MIHLTRVAAPLGVLFAFEGAKIDGAASRLEPMAGPRKAVGSRWGADDEIGPASISTPEMARAAATLVTTGKSYSLAAGIAAEPQNFGARTWATLASPPERGTGSSAGPSRTNDTNDITPGSIATGTPIAGFGHLRHDDVSCNGVGEGDIDPAAAAFAKPGIDDVPNIVTRGIVLDMTAHYATEIVAEGVAFNRAEIVAQAARQNVEIRAGDVVIFRTGWLKLVGTDNARYVKGEPGLGRDGAQFLIDKGVVAIGADSWGLEAIPFEDGADMFEVHRMLLAQSGVYILENIRTDDLIADGVSEFMFVLGPSQFAGGVQAVVNPTAIC